MIQVNKDYIVNYWKKLFARFLFNRYDHIYKMLDSYKSIQEIKDYLENDKIRILDGFNLKLQDVYKK